MKKFNQVNSVLLMLIVSIIVTAYGQTTSNWVDGSLVQFTQDAAWCWFQDERAVIDTNKNKLVVGSTNKGGSVDVVIYDIAGNKVDSKKTFAKLDYADDHNAPGLLVAPNGNYIAIWAHHYDKYNSHYSIFNGQSWSAEKTFDWSKIPGGTDYTIAYSNVYYLSSEKRMYDFARANDRAPNFLYSDDNGNTWQFGGQLTTNGSNSYNKGYYKYWSNGIDRIDMVFTEQHPRDDTTSIYHGYISGKKSYSTFGVVADDDIYTKTKIPSFSAFTKVFAHNTKVNGVTMGRCWESDLMRYNDSSIAILFEARANNAETDHRNFYARFDGKKWDVTYLGKAGGPMYADEQDYTGLGALCPDDPNRIYISSPYKPGDDNSTPKKREIWRGTTSDQGKTWVWEPVTANSTMDNFRPIVPKWKPGKEVMLWFRGTYTTAQNFSTTAVGIFKDYSIVNVEKNAERNQSIPGMEIIGDYNHSGKIAIKFNIPQRLEVSVQLFSATGKLLTTLADGNFASGTHQMYLPTNGLSQGVYFCRMSAGGFSKWLPIHKL